MFYTEEYYQLSNKLYKIFYREYKIIIKELNIKKVDKDDLLQDAMLKIIMYMKNNSIKVNYIKINNNLKLSNNQPHLHQFLKTTILNLIKDKNIKENKEKNAIDIFYNETLNNNEYIIYITKCTNMIYELIVDWSIKDDYLYPVLNSSEFNNIFNEELNKMRSIEFKQKLIDYLVYKKKIDKDSTFRVNYHRLVDRIKKRLNK